MLCLLSLNLSAPSLRFLAWFSIVILFLASHAFHLSVPLLCVNETTVTPEVRSLYPVYSVILFDCCHGRKSCFTKDVGNGSRVFSGFVAISGYSAFIQNTGWVVVSYRLHWVVRVMCQECVKRLCRDFLLRGKGPQRRRESGHFFRINRLSDSDNQLKRNNVTGFSVQPGTKWPTATDHLQEVVTSIINWQHLCHLEHTSWV